MNKKIKKNGIKKETKQPMNILINPEAQKGVYSNVALIHHTKNEFIMDFLLQFGGEAQLVSRIILSPAHMILLQKAINQNIANYKNEYGDCKP